MRKIKDLLSKVHPIVKSLVAVTLTCLFVFYVFPAGGFIIILVLLYIAYQYGFIVSLISQLPLIPYLHFTLIRTNPVMTWKFELLREILTFLNTIILTFFTAKFSSIRRALIREKEKAHIQFKSTPVPIWVWQKEGNDFRMIDANDASKTLTQGKESVLMGKLASESYYDSPEIITLMHKAFDSKGIIKESGVYRMRTTGEERYLNAIFAYVPHDILLIHTEDVTEQHYAHEKLVENARELKEANEAKDQFLAMLSHELRTPMASILGYSNLLVSKKLTDADEHTALKAIEHSAKAQLALINDLLDVSRIVSGKIVIKDLYVGIPGIIKQLVPILQPQLMAKKLNLVTNIPNETMFVKGDPERIQQALTSILDNAIKFTEIGGISVDLRHRGLVLDIVISDTGCGIPPNMMNKLFQKFSQGEVGLNRRFKGLGLGLYIAKTIIDLHHGTIHVESTSPKGTSIVVSLPLVSPPLEESVHITPTDENVRLDNIKILAVEDDTDTLDILQLGLKQYGAYVFGVESAERAREALQNFKFDIIVCDIGLPLETGLTFMQKLRRSGNKITSLALTAFEGLQYELEAKENGFDGFLSKPVGLGQLVTEIKRLTSK